MQMNKKLLILGGTSISRQILYMAKQMKLDVYVTDYLADSPCKKLADKNFMVDCTDVDSVVQLIRKEHIDGVITGYADVLLPYYVQICEKAGLPCYANLHAIKATTNKSTFKSLCKQFSIPVVSEYSIQDVLSDKVNFPILIKPVDNSGARGIYICHHKSEFEENYPKALQFSRSKHILIEPYITGKEATIFYYLHENEAYLLGVGDRHMLSHHANMLPLPIGYTFPSLQQNEFIKHEHKKIKKLFHSLCMKEGMVFMQAFNHGGHYIIYEMGYRLTGSIEHHLMGHAHHFNHMKAILDYAVGNPVDIAPLRDMDINNCATANVTLLLSEGTIDHYEGLEEAKRMPGVLHIHLSYPTGTVIDSNIIGKLAQVGVRVLLYADNKPQLLQRMDAVKDAIRVISTENRDMLLKQYSYQEVCQP